jgi:glycosyltransferase involved in cell wall biosynthesis
MNICFVLNFAPHYRTEIYLLLEEELGAYFYFANETLAKNIQKADYRKFRNYPTELGFVKLYGNLNWISGSVKLVFNRRFKKFVIIGEPFCISSWVMMLAARLIGKEIFTWTHGWYGRERGVKRLLKKIYFSIPNGNFLYGDRAKNLMIKAGFKEQKLFVVYNSLHYSKHLELRSGLIKSNLYTDLFKNANPTIIFVGRVTPQKRLDLLVGAQQSSLEHGTPFNVAIIGSGSYENELKGLINSKDMSSICKVLPPSYDEKLLSTYFFNADMCVSPGEVGLTGIHSMSFGTPVITHNNFSEQMPEFEAIIPGITGDFFEQGNAADLKKVIQNWLDKYPEKTETIVRSCFSVVDERYNPDFQLSVFKKYLVN